MDPLLDTEMFKTLQIRLRIQGRNHTTSNLQQKERAMPATAVTSVMRKSIHQLITKMFSSVPSAQSLIPSSHFKVKVDNKGHLCVKVGQ